MVTLSLLIATLFPTQLDSLENGLVYSPRKTFRIPLELTPQEKQRTTAVRLFYSEDEGKTWVRMSDAPADLPIITFEAPKEGSYWFVLALVDGTGQQDPADVRSVDPGLRVVVDTKKPEMLLRPIKSRSGRRGVRWEITDQHLDAKTLRLAAWENEYTGWQPLPVPEDQSNMAWFEAPKSPTRIQAHVKDRAGNERVIEVDIEGDRFGEWEPRIFALDAPRQPPRDPAAAEGSPIADGNPNPTNAAPPAPEKSADGVYRPVSNSNPTGSSADATMARAEPAAAPRPTAAPPTPERTPAAPATPPATAAPPAPADIPLVNFSKIEVSYQSPSPADLKSGRVELWARPPGADWRLLAVDADATSPVEAALNQDGVWGLKVMVRDPATDGNAPLDPNAAADMYVELDSTGPRVAMEAPAVRPGQIILKWDARDKNLASKPVTILYTTSATGRWQLVAEEQPAVGEFLWNTTRAGVAGPVYLRIEARDRAGNTGAAETDQLNVTEGQAAAGFGTRSDVAANR